MGVIDDFDGELDNFKRAVGELADYLEGGTELRALVRYRLGIAARDVVSFCPLLREAHLAAVPREFGSSTLVQQHAEVLDIQRILRETSDVKTVGEYLSVMSRFLSPTDLGEVSEWLVTNMVRSDQNAPIIERLQMSYKSLLYFVRVYFDAAYIALMHLASTRTRPMAVWPTLWRRTIRSVRC